MEASFFHLSISVILEIIAVKHVTQQGYYRKLLKKITEDFQQILEIFSKENEILSFDLSFKVYINQACLH